MTEAVTPERTALYRIWGENDLLLYIGISKDFGGRWKQHARIQPWWGEMQRLAVDGWYDYRVEAEVAEELAIKAERPKYNKTHAAEPAEKFKGRLASNEVITATRERIAERRAESSGQTVWESDKFPQWGSWPDGAWWHTWWLLGRGGTDFNGDELEELRTFYCPERDGTEMLGVLFRDNDDQSDWPVSWVQTDRPGYAGPDDWVSGVYSAHCVIRHAKDRKLCGAAYDIQREFLDALLLASRCSAVNPGHDAAAFGFRDDTEAMAVTTLLAYLAWGHTDTALECIKAIREAAERSATAA